jgi:hypothetical protein
MGCWIDRGAACVLILSIARHFLKGGCGFVVEHVGLVVQAVASLAFRLARLVEPGCWIAAVALEFSLSHQPVFSLRPAFTHFRIKVLIRLRAISWKLSGVHS